MLKIDQKYKWIVGSAAGHQTLYANKPRILCDVTPFWYDEGNYILLHSALKFDIGDNYLNSLHEIVYDENGYFKLVKHKIDTYA